ncbi:MAG TPA: hypothetical protein V6C97_05715 [Oculatellaceae cyanobacterium]
MKAKRVFLAVLSLGALLQTSLPAKADDIDEKQALLQSKINEAASNKQLSSKDASELRHELSDFKEKKRSIRAAHGDVLQLADDKELNRLLSDINQHYEEKLKSGATDKK